VLSVEVDDAAGQLLDDARGIVVGPDGKSTDVLWEREVQGRLSARVPLLQEGLHRAAVQVGGTVLRVPPLCRPYSAEYAPRLDAEAGARLLRQLALQSGGRLDPSPAAVAAGDRRAAGRIDLGFVCALAAALLLLLEIAARRFDLRLPGLARWLARWTGLLRRPRRQRQAAGADAASRPPAATLTPPAPPVGDTLSALERARQRLPPR
jgi:hypothetical protein